MGLHLTLAPNGIKGRANVTPNNLSYAVGHHVVQNSARGNNSSSQSHHSSGRLLGTLAVGDPAFTRRTTLSAILLVSER